MEPHTEPNNTTALLVIKDIPTQEHERDTIAHQQRHAHRNNVQRPRTIVMQLLIFPIHVNPMHHSPRGEDGYFNASPRGTRVIPCITNELELELMIDFITRLDLDTILHDRCRKRCR
jgi:hypothetical protein